MQERTLDLLLEMGARVERAKADAQPATTLRHAEEIAREMVPEPRQEDGERVWRSMIEDADDFVPLEIQSTYELAANLIGDTRTILARLIEQSRAEGAAAERERATPAPADGAAEVLDQLAKEMRDRADKRADAGSAKRGSNVALRRTGEADGLREAASALRDRADWIRAAQQPPDLAGRIRALVQEYAGQWADADDAAADEAYHDVTEFLVQAATRARHGKPVQDIIDVMRSGAELMNPAAIGALWPGVRRRAAAQLEAIVREHGEESRR